MLKSVIEEIYYGNRVFGDESVETENYKEAEAKFLVAYGKLLGKLPAKQSGDERLGKMRCGAVSLIFNKKW